MEPIRPQNLNLENIDPRLEQEENPQRNEQEERKNQCRNTSIIGILEMHLSHF